MGIRRKTQPVVWTEQTMQDKYQQIFDIDDITL